MHSLRVRWTVRTRIQENPAYESEEMEMSELQKQEKVASASNSPRAPLLLNENPDGCADNLPSIVSIDTEALIKNMNDKFDQLTRDMVCLRNSFNEKFEGLAGQIVNWASKFSQLEGTIQSMQTDISTMSGNNSEIQNELADLRLETVKLLSDNQKLRESVNECHYKLSLSEQRAKENNVEIQCLPEHNGENLLKTVMQLGSVVSCQIRESDVVNCTRVGKVNRDSQRPRSVVVRLQSRYMRDKLLAACMKHNKANQLDKLNSSLLGIAGSRQAVYVVEHLSAYNRALQAKARAVKKEKGYRYLWTREGRVLLRKDESSPVIWVKNVEVLASLGE